MGVQDFSELLWVLCTAEKMKQEAVGLSQAQKILQLPFL